MYVSFGLEVKIFVKTSLSNLQNKIGRENKTTLRHLDLNFNEHNSYILLNQGLEMLIHYTLITSKTKNYLPMMH